MSQVTDQHWLRDNFEIVVIQHGPNPGWPIAKDIYLQCPQCGDYVTVSDYDRCSCRCISIDVDAGRVSVRCAPESAVPVCHVRPK